MILTVTLNTALDKTTRWVSSRSARPIVPRRRMPRQAGKASMSRGPSPVPVAVLAAGLAAGPTGEQIERDLEVAGIDTAIHHVEGESRQTVTVVSRRGDTWLEIDEQGPKLSLASWRSFLDAMDAHFHKASIVVLSGSLPPGAPVNAYRHLTELSHGHGTQVVLDATGPAFEDALAAGPEIVTPNRSELASASGLRCGTVIEVVDACRKLEGRGARSRRNPWRRRCGSDPGYGSVAGPGTQHSRATLSVPAMPSSREWPWGLSTAPRSWTPCGSAAPGP